MRQVLLIVAAAASLVSCGHGGGAKPRPPGDGLVHAGGTTFDPATSASLSRSAGAFSSPAGSETLYGYDPSQPTRTPNGLTITISWAPATVAGAPCWAVTASRAGHPDLVYDVAVDAGDNPRVWCLAKSGGNCSFSVERGDAPLLMWDPTTSPTGAVPPGGTNEFAPSISLFVDLPNDHTLRQPPSAADDPSGEHYDFASDCGHTFVPGDPGYADAVAHEVEYLVWMGWDTTGSIRWVEINDPDGTVVDYVATPFGGG